MKRIASKNLGIVLFLIALAIRFIFSFSPIAFESVYFNGIFPIIRKAQSFLSFLWVIPGYYVLAIGLIAWLILRFPRSKNFKLFFKRLANLICGISAAFLVLWGYNYVDKGFAERMRLPHSSKLVDLSAHYLAVMDSATVYRSSITEEIKTIVEVEEVPSDSLINAWVKEVLKDYGYPTGSDVFVQHVRPSGTLRRLSIAGIYNPFTGEANVDNASPALPRIFTTAHEIAHGYGITSEAEANLVAYMACMHSRNPLANYAGAYALWRQMAREINTTFPAESIEDLASRIPSLLKEDRQAILSEYYKYKGYFPALTDKVNDTYLKIQGVQKGTDDYDGFLQLYFRWLEVK